MTVEPWVPEPLPGKPESHPVERDRPRRLLNPPVVVTLDGVPQCPRCWYFHTDDQECKRA